MIYPDGQIAQVGDTVEPWPGAKGVVVCSLDTNEYTTQYPESEWRYLREGILVESDAGLIHYVQAEETMKLISRKAAG